MAVHAGEVHHDAQGVFGEALDLSFRLLNSREVKARLTRTMAPLVLVVSDEFYSSIVSHGYPGTRGEDYELTDSATVRGVRHGA